MRRFAAVALALLIGCQDQEFEPVVPSAYQVRNVRVSVPARQLPPNIMLVVDRSGSMIDSVSGVGPSCSIDGTANSAYDPLSPNTCKWNDLKSALADSSTGFLVQSQALGRFGLLPFPGDEGTCGPGRIAVPIGPSVQPVRFQLMNQIVPRGGTPTGLALREAAKDPALAIPQANRRRYVMLLTDGLPNCAESEALADRCAACNANASSCGVAGGCRPTFGGTTTCTAEPFPGAACLDDDGLVDAVTTLKKKGIETFVIGFGSATTGTDASTILDRAAVEGGHPRSGASVRYYQANTVEELHGYLSEILSAFPCEFKLDPVPEDDRLISVTLYDGDPESSTGRALERGAEWEVVSPGKGAIKLLAPICDQLQNASDDRFRIELIYGARIP